VGTSTAELTRSRRRRRALTDCMDDSTFSGSWGSLSFADGLRTKVRQPAPAITLSNSCVLSTLVIACRLLPPFRNDMVKASNSNHPEMLQLTNRRNGRCARWCAIVVLLAVGSLTINVATRYSYAGTASAQSVKVSGVHATEEHGRQRLTKDAAHWIPPVVVSSALKPASSPHLVADEATPPQVPFASSLYYRPPPAL